MKYRHRHAYWALVLFSAAACGGQADFYSQGARRVQQHVPGAPDGGVVPTSADGDSDEGGDITTDEGEVQTSAQRTEGQQSGQNSEDAVPEPVPVVNPVVPPPVDVPVAGALFWNFRCESTAGTGASPSNASAVEITGPGVFNLAPAGEDTVQLEIAGQICPGATADRDIVFVVDVSDSMRSFFNLGNDPVRNGSCGRLEAVRAVIAGLPDSSRVAIVTFDSDLSEDTGGFITGAEAAADWLSTDILCEKGAGTNFTRGLARAEEILAGARAGTSRELYFISDGEPNSASASGLAEAARIRQGATIATLMLKGDEDFLKNEIASRDAAGVPLHAKVDDAALMAQSLSALADIRPVRISVETGVAADALSPVMFDATQALEFRLPMVTLDRTGYPDGFFLRLGVQDSRGVWTIMPGQLVWP